MKEILIIGAGPHSRVVVDTLQTTGGYRILGATDSNEALWNTMIADGVRVLGDDSILDKLRRKGCYAVIGIGGGTNPISRKPVYDMLISKGFIVPSIIHPFTFVSRSSTIGLGAQIMAGTVIQAGVEVGENAIVNTSASVDHGCRLSPHCHIAPGAVLGGEVEVGEGTIVGIGARVIPGVKIGRKAIIGAGAVVISSVPDRAKVVGVPAKELKLVDAKGELRKKEKD